MAHATDHPSAKNKRWTQLVSQHPTALDQEPGQLHWSDPERITVSLWQATARSQAGQRSVYASASAMLRLTINRRGRSLAEPQRQIQEEAKRQLQQLQQSSAESDVNPPAEPAATTALQ